MDNDGLDAARGVLAGIVFSSIFWLVFIIAFLALDTP